MSKFAPHRRSQNNPRATSSTICQKCLGTGHFIYECKSARPYVSRPSRTQQLEKPGVLEKIKLDGKPSVEVPEEFKKKSGTANRILEAKEKERKEEKEKDREKGQEPARKRAKRLSSGSSSGSGSLSDSDSSSSGSDSGSSSSDSDSFSSRGRGRKRRVARRSRSRSSSGGDSSDESRGSSRKRD